MHPSWKYGAISGIFVFALFIAGYYINTNNSSSNTSSVELKVEDTLQPVEIEEPEEPQEIELPFGGRQLLPNYRFVALYGNGDYKRLGALGEQPLNESIVRARELAKQYQHYSEEPVIPTFEIITTLASSEPTEDNDYSREISIEKLRPWIDAAADNKFYVLLDLQPGRSTFLSQALKYEELLKLPHVGLALDPEWRLLDEKARHLVKVGSVSATEINKTSQWLADLTKQHKLPQKMFLVHQFKLSMITERETLITNREELAYVLHMDGHGALSSKVSTWNTIKEGLTPNLHLGWKNFHDEDLPTPTPEETMLLTPKPWFISYQ